MKNVFCIQTSLCLFVILVLLLIPAGNAYGVGLGPSEIRVSDALRGTSVDQSVTLYNLGDTTASINLTVEGDGSDWIHFYDIDTKGVPFTKVTLKARESRPIRIVVSVPSDAANGMYTPIIHAKLEPPEGATSSLTGVSAILEATSTLSITVTGEQKVAGTVEYITVDNSEVNYPVPVKVLFHNTGNVAAKPEIKSVFAKSSATIDSVTSADTEVKAGESKLIVIRWTKTNIDAGNYTADVSVNLNGATISSAKKSFMLEPVGTLSRQGNLTGLSYSGDPTSDAILKIIGTFQNTGTIETKAKMIGEIYRDNSLVDTFTTDELSISINDQGELLYYLKLQNPGTYTIKAYVLYDGKKTETKELAFSTITGAAVGTGTRVGGTAPLNPVLPLLALMGCIMLITLFRRDSR